MAKKTSAKKQTKKRGASKTTKKTAKTPAKPKTVPLLRGMQDIHKETRSIDKYVSDHYNQNKLHQEKYFFEDKEGVYHREPAFKGVLGKIARNPEGMWTYSVNIPRESFANELSTRTPHLFPKRLVRKKSQDGAG